MPEPIFVFPPSTCQVLFMKTAPHGTLFPRCSVIVHHGGSGTSNASVRSGTPTIICPIWFDQFDNSAAVNARGIGVGMQNMRKAALGENQGIPLFFTGGFRLSMGFRPMAMWLWVKNRATSKTGGGLPWQMEPNIPKIPVPQPLVGEAGGSGRRHHQVPGVGQHQGPGQGGGGGHQQGGLRREVGVHHQGGKFDFWSLGSWGGGGSPKKALFWA